MRMTSDGNTDGEDEDEGHRRCHCDKTVEAMMKKAAEAAASVPNPSWTQ